MAFHRKARGEFHLYHRAEEEGAGGEIEAIREGSWPERVGELSRVGPALVAQVAADGGADGDAFAQRLGILLAVVSHCDHDLHLILPGANEGIRRVRGPSGVAHSRHDGHASATKSQPGSGGEPVGGRLRQRSPVAQAEGRAPFHKGLHGARGEVVPGQHGELHREDGIGTALDEVSVEIRVDEVQRQRLSERVQAEVKAWLDPHGDGGSTEPGAA